MMKVDTIYHDDSFHKTQDIDRESIDLIVTSPPYADRRKNSYAGIAPDRYVEWFLPLAAQLKHILKPTGSFILNIKENVVDGQRSNYVMNLVLALQQQGWLWTETYLWYKKNATPGKWPNRFRDAWEYCFHFTKQRDFSMYQDAVKIPIGDWAEKRMRSLSSNDRKRSASATGSGFGRNVSHWAGKESVFPDNVLVTDERVTMLTTLLEGKIAAQTPPRALAEAILSTLEGNETVYDADNNVLHMAAVCNNRAHSAAFPEKLPEFFIKLFTQENDLVFDPFLGSGTTAVVAQAHNRRFLGIELKEDYFNVASVALGLNNCFDDDILFANPCDRE